MMTGLKCHGKLKKLQLISITTASVREWTLFIPGERSEDNWEGVLKKYGVMERGSEKNGIL